MRGRRIGWSVIALVVAFFVISAAVIVWDGLTDELGVADVAVVLGNRVEGGAPSAPLQARLDRALELYEEGLVGGIIVSGGIGREGYDEAETMRGYLVDLGVPMEDVGVDSGGYSTYLTARNVSRIMEANGLESAVVVTQYYHVPRARLALERSGVSQVYTAHAEYFGPRDVYSTAREVIAYFYYLARSYDRVQP